jgi:hypothetical protein
MEGRKNSRIEQIAFTTLDALADWTNILLCPGSIYKMVRQADKTPPTNQMPQRTIKYILAGSIETARIMGYAYLLSKTN